MDIYGDALFMLTSTTIKWRYPTTDVAPKIAFEKVPSIRYSAKYQKENRRNDQKYIKPTTLWTNLYNDVNVNQIVRNRFPLIVFGRSDISGQFHPIAVALTSRETTDDYSYFFK